MEKRLQAILKGAFAGSPTPLKDIPKRDGDIGARDPNQYLKRRLNVNKPSSAIG